MQKRETAKKRELSKCVRNDSININFYFTTLNLLSFSYKESQNTNEVTNVFLTNCQLIFYHLFTIVGTQDLESEYDAARTQLEANDTYTQV